MWLELMLEDDFDEGRAIGISEGERLKLVSQVKKKLAKGNTSEEIADLLEEDVELIRGIVREITE